MKDWRLEQIKQIRAYGLRAEPTALLLAIDDLLSEVATHEPASPVAQPERDASFQFKEELDAKLWPSDLPANGMGAMNLITNFWTGDLKGLTKEGARIVDSLVEHVILKKDSADKGAA